MPAASTSYLPAIVIQDLGVSAPGFLSFGWSVHARILPFLEAGAKFDRLNLDIPQESPENTTVQQIVVDVFLCPSDPRANQHRTDRYHHNTNYGVNRGDWHVWAGFGQADPAAPFFVNSSVRLSDIADGTNQTLFLAEAKVRLPFIRNCTNLAYEPTSSVPQPPVSASASVVDAYTNCTGGALREEHSHTEWHYGNVHHSGFTTAWTPNRQTAGTFGSFQGPDVNLLSMRESQGGPTYAAVTARSYHSGGVNCVLGDGSVRFVSDRIDGSIWRSLGTIAGGEIVSGF